MSYDVERRLANPTPMNYAELLAEIDAALFFVHQNGEQGEPLATEGIMQRRDVIRAELARLYYELAMDPTAAERARVSKIAALRAEIALLGRP